MELIYIYIYIYGLKILLVKMESGAGFTTKLIGEISERFC